MGAWIEIPNNPQIVHQYFVAPPVGAWIEIIVAFNCFTSSYVAPPVGAWIEICFARFFCSVMYVVAPPVGAWIEIIVEVPGFFPVLSLPPWERGLKSHKPFQKFRKASVAPPVGAWIEIPLRFIVTESNRCRSPRGSVD